MSKDEIRSTVLSVLASVAPEADPAQIQPDVNWRDQLDIDSMDFLKFVIGLHKKLQIDIPENNYPKLLTLNGCIDYLETRLKNDVS